MERPCFTCMVGSFRRVRERLSVSRAKPTKEATMFKAYVMPAVAGVFLLGLATAAWAVTGEFGNMCAMSLAAGKDTQTDCSIHAQLQGKTYCSAIRRPWLSS